MDEIGGGWLGGELVGNWPADGVDELEEDWLEDELEEDWLEDGADEL